MRIVLDLQGAQTGSRFRGIGRYSMSLAKAMIRNGKEHEFFVVLNGLFPETIGPIRAELEGLVPFDNIRVWDAAGPVHAMDPANDWRRQAAELTREAFIQSLNPDFVHISSLMEGFGDDGVHSIGRAPHPFPVAVTFYDLIPLIQKSVYLDLDPPFRKPYYEKLDYMERADLLFAISESSRQEAIEHLHAFPEDVINIGAAVDDVFRRVPVSEETRRVVMEKYGVGREFIMYSGATDDRKNHLGLIEAYSLLPLEMRQKYQLVLVGGLPRDHKEKFRAFSRLKLGDEDDVVITDRVTDEELLIFYNLCSLYVFPSWHEGFGLPALEALACGAPVIGSNNTSIPEVLGRQDVLFDPFSPVAIAAKIEEVISDPDLLQDLRAHGPVQAGKFSWDVSARRALEGMEAWHRCSEGHSSRINRFVGTEFPPKWLFPKIERLPGIEGNEWCLDILRDRVAHSRSRFPRALFVDVSELVQRDGKSGIQRVVRSILKALFRRPPEGFLVKPVYATTDSLGYRYATEIWRQYCPEGLIEEGYIDFCSSDVFFGLDMQHHVIPCQSEFYGVLRKFGVRVYFLIHDLLPVLSPEFFPPATYEDHRRWLKVLSESADGLVCVSRTVSEELKAWLQENPPARAERLLIGWSHNGADIDQSVPTCGLPDDAGQVLEAISGAMSFLSVSTIEPRKGHAQILDAADLLWAAGEDVCLVFVGKQGWNVEALAGRIKNHRYFGKRLFWLNGVSDEYLAQVYRSSKCLLAASLGEGFGLPIVEAAINRIPMIVRDIPVHREVAGHGACYFSGLEGRDLAAVMRKWIADYRRNLVLMPDGVKVIGWQQSTENLLKVILGGEWSDSV